VFKASLCPSKKKRVLIFIPVFFGSIITTFLFSGATYSRSSEKSGERAGSNFCCSWGSLPTHHKKKKKKKKKNSVYFELNSAPLHIARTSST
jgi:hypothetical protein